MGRFPRPSCQPSQQGGRGRQHSDPTASNCVCACSPLRQSLTSPPTLPSSAMLFAPSSARCPPPLPPPSRPFARQSSPTQCILLPAGPAARSQGLPSGAVGAGPAAGLCCHQPRALLCARAPGALPARLPRAHLLPTGERWLAMLAAAVTRLRPPGSACSWRCLSDAPACTYGLKAWPACSRQWPVLCTKLCPFRAPILRRGAPPRLTLRGCYNAHLPCVLHSAALCCACRCGSARCAC